MSKKLFLLAFLFCLCMDCSAQSVGSQYIQTCTGIGTPKISCTYIPYNPQQQVTFRIGTVTTLAPGSQATASITGTSPNFVLNLGIPAGRNGTNGTNGTNGINGTNGTSATVAVGTTTTIPGGGQASVTNSGTSSAAVFNFVIPAGINGTNGTNGTNGNPGHDGQNATITIGTVAALPPGSTPTVQNVGTPTNAVLNFGLTTGDTGAKGDPATLPPGLTFSADGTTMMWNGVFQTTAAGPSFIGLNGMQLSCTASGPKCQ